MFKLTLDLYMSTLFLLANLEVFCSCHKLNVYTKINVLTEYSVKELLWGRGCMFSLVFQMCQFSFGINLTDTEKAGCFSDSANCILCLCLFSLLLKNYKENGGSRMSGKGARMYKGVGVRFADFISFL